MHASTPLPSPPLGCPTLFYPPFPYSHYPSSPLHYHRIPSLNSAPLRSTYPTLSYTLPFPRTPSPPLPYHTPSLLYHTLSPTYPPLPYHHLGNPVVPSLPALPSTSLPYAILPSHLIYSLSPSTLSSHQFPTPHHPFLTPLPYSPLPSAPLSHHSLLSLNPLTWHTLPCHLPSPTPPICPPFSPPLGHPILSSRPYPPILSHFLTFPRTPSAPLPRTSSTSLLTLLFPTIRSTRISSPLVPYPALSSHPLPYLSSTLPYPSGRPRGRKVSFSTLL